MTRSTVTSRMFRRVLHMALFVGLVLGMWVFAHPALAMPAGLCDDRGASAIAPAPALEVPDVAIMRARASAVCPRPAGPVRATIARAHRVFVPSSSDTDRALQVGPVPLAPSMTEKLQGTPYPTRPPLGIRVRIERPPRG